MPSSPHRLALIGHGHVAQSLLRILEAKRAEHPFEVAGIHTRRRPAAPDTATFLRQSAADILVELSTLNPATGEPAISHIRAAFSLGMHVVTANKGPIAHACHELRDEARSRGLLFRFESSVMDGAPVFNLVRNNLPGVRVLGFTGVLNSTTNLILEAMEQGRSFDKGLRHAQALGVAEADASHDIDGFDSAAKTAALANVLLDARITPQQVERQGIRHITPETAQQLHNSGQTFRLLSEARDGRYRAYPAAVPRTGLLGSLHGTSNLLLLHTDHMGTLGTLSLDPGVEQTAYGVYIDLLDLLR